MDTAPEIEIRESEYTLTATRSSGPGGQHVNKVSTAITLRFDIEASSLDRKVKDRLLASKDSRITDAGVLVIQASSHRSQKRNREDAVERLREIVSKASVRKKRRKPTSPTKASVEKRLKEKSARSEVKALRKKPE